MVGRCYLFSFFPLFLPRSTFPSPFQTLSEREGEREWPRLQNGVLTRKAYEREAGKYCSFSREEKRINLFIFNVRYRNAAKWAEGRGDRTVEQETDCSYWLRRCRIPTRPSLPSNRVLPLQIDRLFLFSRYAKPFSCWAWLTGAGPPPPPPPPLSEKSTFHSCLFLGAGARLSISPSAFLKEWIF